MGLMEIQYRLMAILLCCLLLLTAGCAKPTEPPEVSTAGATTGSEETTGVTEPEETAEITEPADAEDASLHSLRQAMVETPQLFAVAYFGYHDTIDSDDPVDPYTVMQEQAPELCKDLPFLLEIPKDRVIGNHGDLFCIVPLDENATVAVSKGTWDETSEQYLYEHSLYFADSGEPILLFCNNADFEPDTQLCISGSSGTVTWHPRIDDNLCAMPLRNDDLDLLFFDFSPYREMLAAEYSAMKENMEWEGVLPTKEMLIGKTWVWYGYLKDGREVRYRVTFDEEVLSVYWNDGIDASDHEYMYAPWSLTYEQGYAVLTVDFLEFTGVRRYNLMYSQFYGDLYVGMDVLQEEMPIGWEPLYRFMMPPVVPEPVEMLGEWELAWTEVEGYRENVEPGTESISIFLNDDNGFRITLTDAVFPKKSFKNKELEVYEGELYSGCGNDRWMCYIGYMGAENIIYSLTLTQDDILLMEMYWEIDGGVPMVAHKGYRRMGS